MESKNLINFKVVSLTDQPGKTEYKQVSFDLNTLPSNYVAIKMQYAAVGPFDINIFNHYYSSTKDQFNSFGFEGVGTVTHVGKEVDSKAFIGKKLAFMKVDAIAQAYSEYAIVPVGSTIFIDEKTLKNEQLLKERAYLIGSPFTAKGLLEEVLLTHNHKSIVMDTANSSLGQIVACLCDKHNIQLINIVRSEQGVKTMESINKSFININSSESDYLNKFKDGVKDRNPSLYVTFQGGNLPSRIFELMPYRTSMVTLGVINNEKHSGFSTVPFIFHEKKIFGYTIYPYLRSLIDSNKTNEVGQELMNDPCYSMSFDFKEFKLSEFEKAVEFQKTSKTKVLLVPDN